MTPKPFQQNYDEKVYEKMEILLRSSGGNLLGIHNNRSFPKKGHVTMSIMIGGSTKWLPEMERAR